MEYQALRGTFIDKIDVYYPDTKSDGHGGVIKVWTQKYWSVPCRFHGMSGRFTIAEGGIEYPVIQKLLCDVDINISKGDKVVNFEDDENYIALQSNIPRGMRKHHAEVLLGRLEE
jgi:hypothetical protein